MRNVCIHCLPSEKERKEEKKEKKKRKKKNSYMYRKGRIGLKRGEEKTSPPLTGPRGKKKKSLFPHTQESKKGNGKRKKTPKNTDAFSRGRRKKRPTLPPLCETGGRRGKTKKKGG